MPNTPEDITIDNLPERIASHKELLELGQRKLIEKLATVFNDDQSSPTLISQYATLAQVMDTIRNAQTFGDLAVCTATISKICEGIANEMGNAYGALKPDANLIAGGNRPIYQTPISLMPSTTSQQGENRTVWGRSSLHLSGGAQPAAPAESVPPEIIPIDA